jgi:chromosome segregation protein
VYLKQLEILGFKSFANKTVIRFSEGITAVVGPNGCGKTNILDALRWVLGEQRVSLLRGSRMEEIIFNGTRDLPPIGMAEVTLTVVNDRGVLPIEYTEVQITRRLFRSGDSEYLLNKVPCRLRDITELFYDTGMGAHSYSVIQQDMIEAVISDEAEERRFLFEEAAGITKYKQRKKAALRKLEATENDFLRLNDIYSEVKTQVESLRRQQKKAERYKGISDDIRAWELYLNSTRVQALDSEKRLMMAERDTFADSILAHETALDTVSAELEAERIRQIDIERELNQIGAETFELSEKAHSVEKEISVLREKRLSALQLIDRNDNDIRALNSRSELLTEQKSEIDAELERVRASAEEVAEQLRTAETAQADADKRLMEARGSREHDNKRLIELEGKLSSGRTEDESIRQQMEELTRTVGELDSQLQSAAASSNQTLQRKLEIDSRLQSLREKKSDLESTHTGLIAQIESTVEQCEELGHEVSQLSAGVEAAQARKNLLADMLVHYEGYESAVVSVMSERARWPKMVGTVAERFVPNAGMENLLEIALGDIAEYLICEDRTTAEEIVSYVRKDNRGRIGMLVPESGMLNPVVKRPEISADEFVGWLDAFVTAEESLRPLMATVLSRTAVFKAGTNPTAILERLPYGFSAISTDGTLYTKNQIVGGSQDDTFPLFRRKERVAEQELQVADLGAQLEARRNERNSATAHLAALRAESSNLVRTIETVTEDAVREQGQLSEVEFHLRTISNDSQRLTRERAAATGRIEGLQNRQYSLGLDFSTLAKEKEELSTELTTVGSQLEDRERAASMAIEAVSRLQMAAVEARSRREQSESKRTHTEEILADIHANISAKSSEIDTARIEIGAVEQRVATLEIDLKQLFETRTTLVDKQAQLRGQQAAIMEQVTSHEKQIKQERQAKDAISEKIHHLEIRLTTMDSEMRTVIDRTREDYDVDALSINPICPNPEMTEEKARELLVHQKDTLKKFGGVNLLALEEYQQASEREKFLSEQLADLTAAKNDLQATITKINQTAKRLFQETFEKVKTNFQTLFVELFNGGEADIILADPSNPLESTIEIVARPRGKKLISITMMSGGERALTAISLLFSLYLVKPSPFCILDEIDAPLDDANCNRFLKIIRNFAGQTQFICITHNKITMAAADNLYGVTMEQLGISKLVAVRFTETTAGPGQEATVRQDVEEPAELPESKLTSNASRTADSQEGIPSAVRERLTPKISVREDTES